MCCRVWAQERGRLQPYSSSTESSTPGMERWEGGRMGKCGLAPATHLLAAWCATPGQVASKSSSFLHPKSGGLLQARRILTHLALEFPAIHCRARSCAHLGTFSSGSPRRALPRQTLPLRQQHQQRRKLWLSLVAPSHKHLRTPGQPGDLLRPASQPVVDLSASTEHLGSIGSVGSR